MNAAVEPGRPPFADRVILVTGASSGLGRATALALAAQGASVILLARSVPALESVYDDIIAAGGPQPAILPLDLSKATAKEFEQLASLIDSEFGGRLHGIVHCAAHFKNFQALSELQPFDWVEALQVNLIAPWGLTRACYPQLCAATDAAVLFIGCATGKAYQGAYGTSKAALEGMAQSWAAEQKKVRIEVLDPGPMRTPLRKRGYPGETDVEVPPPQDLAPKLLERLRAVDGG